MHHISTIEGQLQAEGLRFALVASRFNDFIVDRLISGAVDVLLRHGGSREDMRIVRVPGAFDMPVVVKQLAAQDDLDGIICLGAVIRGSTPHFDYVAAEVSKGLANVSLESGKAVGFGVLTTDSLEQAIERAGSKAGNKGAEAALAALETAHVLRQLQSV
ncbi:6,7-dimethyl-8-ribityllumazine synthase [Desulfovermiculus halophilus]|uniref:6,7-dimethyl-8-ribityllumazine synthase n=1 Tax=Desulfovermiculus halophilus TaxID=339722 RepID=UPI0004804EF2|nr:6,7-dimethyl-8-ribityllumazine synthase [Desulfovermiculus halophilus]